VEFEGGRIEGFYVCPHGWDEGCDCRKPSPGMLFQAQRDWTLDLSRTWFLGDDDRDAEAAQRAGCPFMRITPGSPLIAAATKLLARENMQMEPGNQETDPSAQDKELSWQNAF
jgi:D-glycero-D-manno-heptose 1,7-bisphosphate phosphatase